MKRIYIVLFIIAGIILGIYSVKIENFNLGGNTRYTNEEMKARLFPKDFSKLTLYNVVKIKLKRKKNTLLIKGVA